MPPAAPVKNPGHAPALDPQGLKDLWHFNLTNHTPTPVGIKRIEALRSAAMAMADAIIDLCPAGRDQAMALSGNEEMLFHAVAAVARTMNVDVDKTPDEDNVKADDSAESGKDNG